MLHLFYFTFKLIQNIAFLKLTCRKTLFAKEKYIIYDVFSYTIYIYIYIYIYIVFPIKYIYIFYLFYHNTHTYLIYISFRIARVCYRVITVIKHWIPH